MNATGVNTVFTFDAFNVAIQLNLRQNTGISPLMITAGLGMLLLGAQGDTAEQLETGLRFDMITGSGSSASSPSLHFDMIIGSGSSASSPGLHFDMIIGSGSSASSPDVEAQCDRPGGPHSQFKTLLADIKKHTKNYVLSTVNRLYGGQQFEFHQKFLQCTKEMYGAELKRADFQHSPEESRNEINSWVEAQTNGKINDFLPPDSITPSDYLVLVNAMCFQGKWQSAFKETDTKERLFHIDENQSKNVQMMYQEHEFNWAEIKNPKMKVLEMPYDQRDFSMIILLPENKEAMDQVEKDMTYAKSQQWMSKLKKEKIRVFLPKFKMETKCELKSILEALGMRDIFSEEKADLSGMSKSKLVLSKAIHQVYVEVNEEGTEAAGATGIVEVPVSAKKSS